MRNVLLNGIPRMIYIVGLIITYIVMSIYDQSIKEYHYQDYIIFIICAIIISLFFILRGINMGITMKAMVIFTICIWLTVLQSVYSGGDNFLLLKITTPNFFSMATFIKYGSFHFFPIILGIILLIFSFIPKGYFKVNYPMGIWKLLFQEGQEI